MVVRRGFKLMEGLESRVRDWNQLPAAGTRGTNTKLVRKDKGTAAYHKPGSQSGRKGYGRRKMAGKK